MMASDIQVQWGSLLDATLPVFILFWEELGGQELRVQD